jgi:hypothetical protein
MYRSATVKMSVSAQVLNDKGPFSPMGRARLLTIEWE